MKYCIGDKVYIVTKWGRKEFVITNWTEFPKEYILDGLYWIEENDIDGLVE